MKQALFYEKLAQNKVKCTLCNQSCLIFENQRGLCGVRENKGGELYSLVYGKVIAQHVDPIEKKPLYHFLPGTQSYSIATVGCNLRCQHCQNADISQASREGFYYDRNQIPGVDITSPAIVGEALKNNCPSISYTYTEPTIFYEFALDCMKQARQQGLKNVWVTNGYITAQALQNISSYLDAANVDLKFFQDKNYRTICSASLKPVLNTLRLMKELNIWLEITTLIIPKLNDSDEELTNIAKFIYNDLGSQTPWHVSAFYPTYKMINTPQTPTKTILTAIEIGQSAGLKYVYGGNISDLNVGQTRCQQCQEVVISRIGYQTKSYLVDNNKCPKCKAEIEGIF